jgi:hypothetical protein
MRIVSPACGIGVLLSVGFACAQTPSDQKTVPTPTVARQPTKYDVATTRMGVLLADPAAKAVLAKYIPQLVDSADLQQATSMSLKDLQQALQAYAPDLLSDKVLAQIQGDFDKLPPIQ